MHCEFIFITSSRSKQKLNVTPGLQHRNESRCAHMAFFSKAYNRHKRWLTFLRFFLISNTSSIFHIHFYSTLIWKLTSNCSPEVVGTDEMSRSSIVSFRQNKNIRQMYDGSIASEMVQSKRFINKKIKKINHFRTWQTFLDVIMHTGNFLSRHAKLRKAILCTVYLFVPFISAGRLCEAVRRYTQRFKTVIKLHGSDHWGGTTLKTCTGFQGSKKNKKYIYILEHLGRGKRDLKQLSRLRGLKKLRETQRISRQNTGKNKKMKISLFSVYPKQSVLLLLLFYRVLLLFDGPLGTAGLIT